jgi:hypothetical protein
LNIQAIFHLPIFNGKEQHTLIKHKRFLDEPLNVSRLMKVLHGKRVVRHLEDVVRLLRHPRHRLHNDKTEPIQTKVLRKLKNILMKEIRRKMT